MIEIDNILSLDGKLPLVIIKSVAAKVKQRRLESNLTQKELAGKSGISLASYIRFERTGEISFHSLLKIATVLNAENDFNLLFSNKIYNSIEDILNQGKTRKRGKSHGKN
jgi:transcriptional regulator with XRE-family HTH domain